jgi:hypothetical protein
LTAAGRSENPTEIRERGLVRNGLAASLPLVGYARISLADLVNWKEFTM